MRRVIGGVAAVVVAVGCNDGTRGATSSGAPTSAPEAPAVAAPAPADAAAVAVAPDESPGGKVVPWPGVFAARLTNLVEALPAVDFAPALPAKLTDDVVTKRLALAAGRLASGDTERALALLAELARRGADIEPTRVDDAWRRVWDDPTYAVILGIRIAANTGDDAESPHWWEAGGAGCPKGTRMKSKWRQRDASDGRVWCEKRGGIKHGPYWQLEMGCHDGEGTCSASGQYDNGVRVGYWSESPNYYGSEDGFYRKGKRHGYWYAELKVGWTDAVYVDGELHGVQRTYGEDSRLFKEETYVRGKREGPSRTWNEYEHEPYHLVAEGDYRNDRQHGTWVFYSRETGAEIATGAFAAGVPDGTWTMRFEDQPGKTQTLELARGKLVAVDGAPPSAALREAWRERRDYWSFAPRALVPAERTP